MRNRKTTILSGVSVLLILAVLFYASRENDPLYKGKRLSQYLKAFRENGLSLGGVTYEIGAPARFIEPGIKLQCSDTSAYEAISQVGTNALPMLVHMLRSKDSRLALWIWDETGRHPFISKHLRLKPPTAGWASQISALAAFRELGPRAAPAIPKIIPLLDDPGCAHVALVAIMFIRPQRERDILSLTNVLRIRTESHFRPSPSFLHPGAILTLATFGAKGSGAVPLLMDCLDSTNGDVQAASAVALLKIAAPPGKVVPLILEHLPIINPPPFPPMNSFGATGLMQQRLRLMQQRHMEERNLAMNIWALGEYGHHAVSALAVLSNLQHYPLVNLQEAAKQAMAKIKADTSSVLP